MRMLLLAMAAVMAVLLLLAGVGYGVWSLWS